MLDMVASLLVDLSEQKMYVTMESGKVEEIRVSTGKAATPTPLMTDSIATKYELTDLIGRNYSWRIRDVPHVMCFSNNPLYCIHPRTRNNCTLFFYYPFFFKKFHVIFILKKDIICISKTYSIDDSQNPA